MRTLQSCLDEMSRVCETYGKTWLKFEVMRQRTRKAARRNKRHFSSFAVV